MYFDERAKFIGKKLGSVSLSADKSRVFFHFADGGQARLRVKGDCCSESWIEHLEVPGDLEGAEITGIDESGGVDLDVPEFTDGNPQERLQVYRTTFHTTAGDIDLEFRNSSNGYYGGWLEEAK